MTDLESIIVRRRLGRLTGADLVAWGVAALGDDLDSESLRRLAGLDLEGDLRVVEAEELFFKALGELGLSVPSEDAAIREYVRCLAQEIVDGAATPLAQVDKIHREVLSPLNHPKDLMVWCYVHVGLRPREQWSLDADAMVHFESIPEPRLDETIRELAQWYLSETRAA